MSISVSDHCALWRSKSLSRNSFTLFPGLNDIVLLWDTLNGTLLLKVCLKTLSEFQQIHMMYYSFHIACIAHNVFTLSEYCGLQILESYYARFLRNKGVFLVHLPATSHSKDVFSEKHNPIMVITLYNFPLEVVCNMLECCNQCKLEPADENYFRIDRIARVEWLLDYVIISEHAVMVAAVATMMLVTCWHEMWPCSWVFECFSTFSLGGEPCLTWCQTNNGLVGRG